MRLERHQPNTRTGTRVAPTRAVNVKSENFLAAMANAGSFSKAG